MEFASALSTNSSSKLCGVEDDFLECSICLHDVQQPKALPCLHTYCRHCLQDLVKKTGGRQITCPLCKETSRLPKTGVDGLKTNFLINKLKEKKSILEKLNKPKIPCTNCEKHDAEATARCLQCRDFLCDKCLHSHKEMRILREHTVCTLEEARSGNVDLFQADQTEDTCEKHQGQVLRFFCKKCWIPTCRDCTVIEHSRPEHENVSLDDIFQEQKEEIQELANACLNVAVRVDRAIEKANKTQGDLDEAARMAKQQIDEAADQSLANFKVQLQVKSRKPKQSIDGWKESRTKDIQSKQQSLTFLQVRLRTALEMAQQVTSFGSPTDMANVFSELSTTLVQLRKLQPVNVQSSMGKIKFTPIDNCKTMATRLGELSLGLEAGHWELESNLIVGRDKESVNDIAVTSDGELVLATAKSEACAKIFDVRKRNTKSHLDTSFCLTGHNVVVMMNGNICTCSMSDNVTVFGHDGRELFQFSPKPPVITPVIISGPSTLLAADFSGDSTELSISTSSRPIKKSPSCREPSRSPHSSDSAMSSSSSSSMLSKSLPREMFKFSSASSSSTSKTPTACAAGLAVNSRGELLVGDIIGKFISVHQSNGDHITSFEVPIEPMYIAVAERASTRASANHEDDRIIVSSSKQHSVMIVDTSGKVSHSLARPPGVKKINWEPTGVAFSDSHGEGIIFVSNNAQGEDVDLCGFLANSGFAVYCYSGVGEYLSCVTTQVVYPRGLAMIEDDEEKLLVADEEGVKVFHLK